jgi:hypothetical protein
VVTLILDRLQRRPTGVHAAAEIAPGMFTLGVRGSLQ